MSQNEFETLEKCPYCESKKIKIQLKGPDRLTNIPGEFLLSKCSKCGLSFQNPRIKESYIDKYYPDSLGYYRPKEKKKSTKKLRNRIRKVILINHFNYHNLGGSNIILKTLSYPLKNLIRNELVPNYVPKGNLLEIGCSHGSYLKTMTELGWNATGVEMNKEAAEYAKSKHKLKIHNCRLDEFPIDKKYDVIVLNMVLEHLYNPIEVIKKLSNKLTENGQLIFAIPYFNGIEFKLFKNYAYGLQLPTHTFFFTKKIIKRMLRDEKYTKIHFTHPPAERDLIVPLQYISKDKNKPLIKKLTQVNVLRKAITRPISTTLASLKISSRLIVFAKK